MPDNRMSIKTKRIIIICEGNTEQEFCRKILQPHFLEKHITIHPPLIKHSHGGIVKWPTLKNEIEIHLKSDTSAHVTTFIDYYGLYSKHLFPDWEKYAKIQDCNERVTRLEQAMSSDLSERLRYRFIPYLQLHEFKGLLFNDKNVFYEQIPKDALVGEKELEEIFAEYDNPELINNNKDTSPSHRLQRIIKGYNKILYSEILAEAIGLERIRKKSPRFNNWISILETL